jgi:hypothetical protein
MTGPSANASVGNEVERLRRVVARQELCGLASDTKWNELLEAMRTRSGWTPAFRYKCIDSDFVSRWDFEWWHHVPMPFISVSWIEIQHSEFDRRLPPTRIDHAPELSALLDGIGLDYRIRPTAIRIFGYAPRDEHDY